MNDQEVIDRYFSTLVAAPTNTNRLFAIGFIGLPGTGKTTISSILAERLDLPVVSNDDLRRFLNQLGFEGASPRQDLVRIISEARTEWFYQHATSVIVDADFSERRKISEETAARNRASLLLIRTLCSESTVIERILKRQRSRTLHQTSRGDIESYLAARQRHAAYLVAPVFAEIDSEKDLGLQLDDVVSRLHKAEYVT